MSQQPLSAVKVLINAAALLGVLFIMAGLIWIMYHYTRPEPPDRARWAERKKAHDELKAASQEALDNYAMIDQGRGVVRLPVVRAMELAVIEWQNPAAGRSNLLTRLEKATPPLPLLPTGTNVPAATNPAPTATAKPPNGAK